SVTASTARATSSSLGVIALRAATSSACIRATNSSADRSSISSARGCRFSLNGSSRHQLRGRLGAHACRSVGRNVGPRLCRPANGHSHLDQDRVRPPRQPCLDRLALLGQTVQIANDKDEALALSRIDLLY